MKDIFISHSSADQEIAEQICMFLESSGFECWVSYRVGDLNPGRTYTRSITEAIDSSRAFVVLLSNNAIRSEQVEQEVISANERQRFGLRIYPIIIDDVIDENESFSSNKKIIMVQKLIPDIFKNPTNVLTFNRKKNQTNAIYLNNNVYSNMRVTYEKQNR